MLAATLLPGQTIIENAAKEPHIVDLANFLNTMGARITGAGTDTVKIRGVNALRGGTYAIIPDQIEAGTYLAAVTAVGGNVLVQNVIPKHMECITSKLQEMGAKIINYDDSIRIMRTGKLRQTTVKTRPYPGFPTDMQAQVCVCMALAGGTSRLTESVYETRFFGYCTELESMGASIRISGKTATVTGVDHLTGSTVLPTICGQARRWSLRVLRPEAPPLWSTFISLNGATRIWWKSSGRWARISAGWRMNLKHSLGGSEPVQSRFLTIFS